MLEMLFIPHTLKVKAYFNFVITANVFDRQKEAWQKLNIFSISISRRVEVVVSVFTSEYQDLRDYVYAY